MYTGKPIEDCDPRRLAEEGLEELEAERKEREELLKDMDPPLMIYASSAFYAGDDDFDENSLSPAAVAAS